jgi:hypothetical protein
MKNGTFSLILRSARLAVLLTDLAYTRIVNQTINFLKQFLKDKLLFIDYVDQNFRYIPHRSGCPGQHPLGSEPRD